MAITTFDGIISARATSGKFWDWFDGTTANQTPIAGAWFNLTSRIAQTARATTTYTGFVNASTNGAIMNAATAGAIPIPYSGTDSKYLTAMGAMVSSISGFSALMLIDILWSGGPITYGTSSSVTPQAPAPL